MNSDDSVASAVIEEIPAETAPSATFGFDGSWGIDTVRLSFPVDPTQCDFHAPLWSAQPGYMPAVDLALPSLKKQVVLGGHSVRVELYSSRGFCHIEFNASDFTSAHPYDLALAEAVEHVATNLIKLISHAAWPTFQIVDATSGELSWQPNWQSKVRVNRLDCSRNLLCDDPERIKRALAAMAQRSGSTHHVYTNAGGGWGLVHSTKQAGQEKIYDKTAQKPLPASEARLLQGKSVLRFEAELKKERLETAGMKTLDCLTSVRVMAAIEKRWAATGWGAPIPSEGSIVAATHGMDYEARAKVIGHAVLSEAGVADGLSAKSKRRWDAKSKSAGLVPGMPTAALGEPDCYLDIRLGKLVKIGEFGN